MGIRGRRLGITLAVGATVAGGGLVAAGEADAALSSPTVTVNNSGRTINITVTNPNPAVDSAEKFGSACVPLVLEYRLAGVGGGEPFRWSPEPDIDAEPESIEQAGEILVSAGIAPPQRSASSSVTVPSDGVYMVGAVCESDVEPGARSVGGVPPLAIGAQTGVPVNVSVQGRGITASVTNNTGVAGSVCTAAIGELDFSRPDPYRSEPNWEDPGTVTVTVPRDGYYAVTGVCVTEGTQPGELEVVSYTKPAKVVTVPGGATPEADCGMSLCLPVRGTPTP